MEKNMSNQIRVLLIAPYESLLRIAEQEVIRFQDILLHGVVGDLQTGADIAKRYTTDDYDFVISRGGTAQLIREQTSFPVIDVEPSTNDILRAIHLASAGSGQYAIVGFPAVTRNASVLCDIMRYKIEIFTIHNEQEAKETLNRLVREECPMILCDVVTSTIAHEFGIPSMLITSGADSLCMAFDRIRQAYRYYMPLYEENRMLRQMIQSSRTGVFLFSSNGKQLLSIHPEDMPSSVEDRIREKSWYEEKDKRRVTLAVNGKQYTGMIIPISEGKTAISLREHTVRSSSERFGISYQNREEALDRYFHSFYGVTQPAHLKLYDQHVQKNTPIMILGEIGTGKEQMARLLYCRGPFADAPMCTIDANLLRGRGWEYLMTSPSSPLNDQETCIYFKHIGSLSDEQFSELSSLMTATGFSRANQLIFSLSTSANAQVQYREKMLLSNFGCSLITLPPLREHKNDIPQLASLYIAQLNYREGKESVGFEPEAMDVLIQYDWPGNYDQFKRILKDLVASLDTHYIQKSSVEAALSKEKVVFDAETAIDMHNLSGKTLEEIEAMAVAQAMADHQNNQSEAARQLGIARSSLWRMLKKNQ